MKTAVKLTLLLAFALSLVACATGQSFSEHQAQIPEKNPELGRIFFYRTTTAGFALRPDVLLNNEKVGQAIAKGFFYVDREPGDYVVLVSTEVDRKASFVLEKGQTRYVRFGLGLGFFVGHVYPELVDEQAGSSEIGSCKYTGQTSEGERQEK